ncbi:DNA starvation/stationary phase protection protein [Persicimonas caeni]|uniref:DNA starvation/stationary phase protection protein n=1 Tax=Persicimonas caeni TaxID=2292766 RepID=A0A4Y6PWA0_PERCE|nr:DNA starvation/stationary phase protection protein [Persicimonas caeni]QDG52621.1 DNA starvation/stationary phase protection protein [Persicimonas caeni]QED33843.1 DNA starvation/stationary phase protection protein [Persicimonas caeni]
MATEKTIEHLNTLLADYMVYYQKLRNYHWNVKGHEFFKLHEKFEEGYLMTAEWADDIAERILALGGKPHSTMGEFVENARLNEETGTPNWREMVQNLVDDIQALNENSIDLIESAEEDRDRTTANVIDGIVDAQEENLWMYRTFLKD